MAEAYQFDDNDIISPDIYGQISHPHQAFAWLRNNDPLRFVSPENYLPFWAVTKHADIIEIEKQPDIFTNQPRPIIFPEGSQPDLKEEMLMEIFNRLSDSPKLLEVLATAGEQGLIRSLVQMDPPDHTAYRALTQSWFKPTNIKKLGLRLEVLIREILDQMMGDGSPQKWDFVQDIAVYPPLRLITDLLGVDRSDEWRILKLTNEIFAGDDPEMRRVSDDPLSIFDTIKDIYAFFSELTEKRRASPTEDLGSYIANGKIDGEYLPYKELISYYTIVATAGHDTTRTAMSGGLLALIDNPEQLDILKNGDENTMKLGVEEMIRWSTPVSQFARTATRDYELRGKKIKKGDTLGLFYASANRDEDVFENPEQFNVKRKPNHHLAFGTGPHMCLGVILARMEMRIFFQQLLPRLESLELAGEPDYLNASFVHGLKHLPIKVKLRSAD